MSKKNTSPAHGPTVSSMDITYHSAPPHTQSPVKAIFLVQTAHPYTDLLFTKHLRNSFLLLSQVHGVSVFSNFSTGFVWGVHTFQALGERIGK